MSEDEEELLQRESWKENQRRIIETRKDDNEENYANENQSRNESITVIYLKEQESKVEREKAHLENKQKEREKFEKHKEETKAFEESVENIIANLNFEESYEFSVNLSTQKRQIVHQIATKHNIFHETIGKGKLRQIRIKKLITPEPDSEPYQVEVSAATVIVNNNIDDLSSGLKTRCVLRTPSKRKPPKKYAS